MRVIELKTKQLETGDALEYGAALIAALRVNDRGMDIAEMERAVTCIGLIRKAMNKGAEGERQETQAVYLEEDYFEYLVERVDAQRWRVADPALLAFVKDVKGAEQIEVMPGSTL